MPILLLAILLASTMSAAVAPTTSANESALEAALKSFRTEGPKGWSFTQTTEAGDESRVERYDAAQPEFARWSLVQVNGRAPTADETKDYNEKLTRRSRAGTPPRLNDQLDLATVTAVNETAERTTYRARLKEGEDGDATARFLTATIVLHQPTQTIESFEIASIAPFSPVLGVRIAEMKTALSYSLPAENRPSLLQRSVTRLRGRAFFLKSLDADMTVTFTDYQEARRR